MDENYGNDDTYSQREFTKCREDLYYFIANHFHYGWHPKVILDTEQERTLNSLLNTNAGEITNIIDYNRQAKWPIGAWLLQQALLMPEGKRIAIIASTKREATRRYQGLLYPFDHISSGIAATTQGHIELRTVVELKLVNGSHIKTFWEETKKHVSDFNPDVLLIEDEISAEIIPSLKKGITIVQVTPKY